MDNVNIEQFLPLINPYTLKEILKVNNETKMRINNWRNEIKNIILGKSKKKLFIMVYDCFTIFASKIAEAHDPPKANGRQKRNSEMRGDEKEIQTLDWNEDAHRCEHI